MSVFKLCDYPGCGSPQETHHLLYHADNLSAPNWHFFTDNEEVLKRKLTEQVSVALYCSEASCKEQLASPDGLIGTSLTALAATLGAIAWKQGWTLNNDKKATCPIHRREGRIDVS